MRKWLTRLVILNALIGALFGTLFAVPLGRPEVGFIIGLGFGLITALIIEVLFRRWQQRWLYRRRLLFLVLLEVLLTLYLLLPAYIAYFGLRPARIPVTALPAEFESVAREVNLETTDGITLAGWYIPPQNGAVIITLHGGGGNRLEVIPHARMLIQHGYGVLMMDMRAHGNSAGEVYADGWNASLDAAAMLAYLQAQPDVEHIAALGLSAGAISLLHAAAAHEAIEAVVADGTGVAAIEDLLNPLIPHPAIAWLLVPDYWMSYRFTALFTGLEPAPALRHQVTRIAPRPLLFIAAADSMWESELAGQYVRAAGDSARSWIIPDTPHIAGIHTMPDEYARRVRAFFDAALRPRLTTTPP